MLGRLLENRVGKMNVPLRGYYALVATISVQEQYSSDIKNMMSALADRSWESALQYESWEGSTDNLELYALALTAGDVILALLKSPYNPFDENELLFFETLTISEGASVKKLTKNAKWRPIRTAPTKT